MKTKTQQAKADLEAGKVKEALRVLSTFTMGLDKQDQIQLKRGYECLVRPVFYETLGFDPKHCVDVAIKIAKTKILKES